jgi:hypothetical protein
MYVLCDDQVVIIIIIIIINITISVAAAQVKPLPLKEYSPALLLQGHLFSIAIPRLPPLWTSGQSSWLQIWRPGFDYGTTRKKIVSLERGPLSLVSTTEELLDRKVAAPV